MPDTLIARQATKARRSAYSEIYIGDFSGGLNVRDALTELANNETPDCENVVLDEHGAAHKRLGFVKWNATALPNSATNGYESDVCDCTFWYCQMAGTLWKDDNGLLTLVRTFASGVGATAAFADFAGICYFIHAFDGLFSSTDGINWSAVHPVSGTIPNGDMLATWQNKLWVASTKSNLLTFCAPGDATKWDPKDDAGANYIREGNDYPIACLFGTSGVDVQAQPALLVGKRSGAQGSIHRVTDAATGDYATIDQSIGPAGREAITSLYGRLYMISTGGIFQTDGQSALIPVGAKLSGLFDPGSIDFSKASEFVATRTKDRVRFSLTLRGSSVNDLCLEYHPGFQAFTARTDAARCYVLMGQHDGILVGQSPTMTGQLYHYDVGGADDGQPISSKLLTKVFEPAGGYPQRLQHIRVLGRGKVTVESIADFAKTGKKKDLSMLAEGFQWDFDGWDDPAVGWGEDLIEGWDDFWPRQLGRSFAIRLTETSTDVGTTPPLLGDGPSRVIGAWASYGLHLTITPLHPYG